MKEIPLMLHPPQVKVCILSSIPVHGQTGESWSESADSAEFSILNFLSPRCNALGRTHCSSSTEQLQEPYIRQGFFQLERVLELGFN